MRLARERAQQQPLAVEPLTDGLGLAGDRAIEVNPACFLEQLVELLDRADFRDRHRVPTAEPPDIALHATLLMSPLLARETERTLEPVVRAQRHEPVRLNPPAALQHPRDRSFGAGRDSGARFGGGTADSNACLTHATRYRALERLEMGYSIEPSSRSLPRSCVRPGVLPDQDDVHRGWLWR